MSLYQPQKDALLQFEAQKTQIKLYSSSHKHSRKCGKTGTIEKVRTGYQSKRGLNGFSADARTAPGHQNDSSSFFVGTKGGRFRYMSISVQTRSRSVHVNSAYATSVHRQYNFGTQSVQQEYDFGTRLRNKDADCHSGCCCKLWITSVSPKKTNGYD